MTNMTLFLYLNHRGMFMSSIKVQLKVKISLFKIIYLFFMLLQFSQFFPLGPPIPRPLTPPGSPHIVVHVHGSHMDVLCLLYSYAVLYISVTTL